jgi:hypothetical protein
LYGFRGSVAGAGARGPGWALASASALGSAAGGAGVTALGAAAAWSSTLARVRASTLRSAGAGRSVKTAMATNAAVPAAANNMSGTRERFALEGA